MKNKSRKINHFFGRVPKLFRVDLILHLNLNINSLTKPILSQLCIKRSSNNISLHPFPILINLKLLDKILIIHKIIGYIEFTL